MQWLMILIHDQVPEKFQVTNLINVREKLQGKWIVVVMVPIEQSARSNSARV